MKVPQAATPSRTTGSVNNNNKNEAGNIDDKSRSTNVENPAYLGAYHAYQPRRPSSIRSVSTSSVASEGTAGAASISRRPTPDGLLEHVIGVHDAAGTLSSIAMATRAAPAPSSISQSRSPSHHAALVAAARAGLMQSHQQTPPSISPSASTLKSRPASLRLSTSSSLSIDNDTSSIPPTTSLVSLFERKASSTATGNNERSILQDKGTSSNRPVPPPPIQSPRPRRQNGGAEILEEQGTKAVSQGVVQVEDSSKRRSPSIHTEQRPRPVPRRDRSNGASDSSNSKPIIGVSKPDRTADNLTTTASTSVPASASASASASATTSGHSRASGRPPAVGANAIEEHDFAIRSDPEAVNGKPVMNTSLPSKLPPPIAPRKSQQQPLIRAPTYSEEMVPRRRVTPSTTPSQSIPAAYRQAYPRKTTKLNTDDELANAIVASSLASSRLVASRMREQSSSPQSAPGSLPAAIQQQYHQQQQQQAPPPPLSRRQSRRHIFHHTSRTPSPVKHAGGVLRQTLRKPQETTDSEEDDSTHPYGKHHKKRLIRKHPNKHHEGDRKRWRDALTDTERKRYEGVWAANKGLHVMPMPRDSDQRVDSESLHDQVSNVVVKDIWERSRLPDFELEAVWDLVDIEGIGRLSKEEFVVGLWLIDQRLKGRKLPVKVTPTVWASVRGLQGIKIRRHQ